MGGQRATVNTRYISSSQRVVTGDPTSETFSLPVYLRPDGLALRVGQIVVHNGARFSVRNILVTSGACVHG